jgi:hypothetical protein
MNRAVPAALRVGAGGGTEASGGVPAILRPEQYVDRPGAAGVVRGGAERKDTVAAAKPPVHHRLQDRSSLRGASSLAMDDAHAA